MCVCVFVFPVSIGRRVQDPLAELVKIDPKHIGIGTYQVGHMTSTTANEVVAYPEREREGGRAGPLTLLGSGLLVS